MSRLPIVDAKTMGKLLFRLGFAVARRDLARPLIRQILREIDMSVDEFCRALDK